MNRRGVAALVLASFCLFSSAQVSAEKYDWTDAAYNFKSVKRVMVMDLDTSKSQLDSDLISKVLNGDYQNRAKKLPVQLISPSLAPAAPVVPVAAPAATAAPAAAQPDAVIVTPGTVPDEASAPDAVIVTSQAAPATAAPAAPVALTPEQVQAQAAYQEALAKLTDLYVKTELLTYQERQSLLPAHTEWRSEDRNYTWVDKDGRPHIYTNTVDYPVYVPSQYIPSATVRLRFNVYDAMTGKVVFSREEDRTRGSSCDLRGVYDRMVDGFYKTLKEKIKG